MIFTSVERVVVVEWPIESDTFGFRIILRDQPLTQRRILSTVSSVYDPLGIAAPFLLGGKKYYKISIEQSLVEIGEEFHMSWDSWRSQLPALEHFSMMRSLKPTTFSKVISRQIHSFSDASPTSYGQETYPRITNEKGDIHCAFLTGKVCVAPVKTTTTSRLELTTAAVSVCVGEWLLGNWKSLWKVNSTGQTVQPCWSTYKMWRNFSTCLSTWREQPQSSWWCITFERT